MKKLYFIYLSIFSSILFFQPSFGQEVLTGLKFNPALQKENPEKIVKKSMFLDTLILPFFEDFTQINAPYPNSNKWLDSFVYINNGFAYNPISYGVATFDGLNKEGKPYSKGSTGRGKADKLTSKPIDLNLNVLDSIYLSFFYQPQGWGRAPANSDSLILEFKAAGDSIWNRKWFANGKKVSDFKQILIPIVDNKYLTKGFQFRFRNVAELSGNLDHWNVDYIKIDRLRNSTDTLIYDVAFNSLPSGLLKKYSQMPFNQFGQDDLVDNIDGHFNFIKNNTNIQQTLNYSFNCVEEWSGTPVFSQQRGVVIPKESSKKEFFLPFPVNYGDNPFRLKTTYNLSTDINDFSKTNDTVASTNNFYNFYAYDDGNPEDGYGLSVVGGSLAYKFGIKKADTLSAIRMMFSEIGENVSLQLFTLTVWNQDKNTNKPGEIIYQKFSQTPQYAYGLNGFTDYFLDSILIVQDTIYVGWVQSSNKPLSLGFDRSRNNNDNILYLIDNRGWLNSSLNGTLMIRPVFGDYNNKTSIQKETSLETINLFPNPAKEYIHLNCDQHNASFVYIYNSMGERVYAGPYTSTIRVNHLNSGLYLVQVGNKNGNVIAQGKFIK